MMSRKHRSKNPKIKKTITFIVVLSLVLLVALFQDFLRARYHDYSFYASESILFNLFWVVTFPVAAAFRWLYLSTQFFQKPPSKVIRNLVFVTVATILHLLLFSGLVHLISWAFYEVTFHFWGNMEYSLSEDLYKYLLIYGMVSLIIIRKNLFTSTELKPETYAEYLNISTGRVSSRILVAEILYFNADSPYVAIHTESKKFLKTTTLKALLAKLDPNRFVQIHKSTIVHLSFVQSYRSRLNGDYDIQLANGEELRLSRNYVDNFRHKFESKTST